MGSRNIFVMLATTELPKSVRAPTEVVRSRTPTLNTDPTCHTDRKYKVRVSTSPVREHRVRICPQYPTIPDPELALRARYRAHERKTIRITRALERNIPSDSVGKSDDFGYEPS